jgi:hypothetical protein
MLWCLLSGIGGYAYQNDDFQFRNAVFRDLANYSWPVTLPYQGGTALLVYYFLYWLPSAAIASAFGPQWGALSLYLWTVLGALLVVFQVSLVMRRASVVIPLVLILFSSGCDIVPMLARDIATHHPYAFGDHLEWWGGFQYSSLTSCLYWVFNQAIPVWLGTALILNKKSYYTRFFTAVLVYPFAPFGFIGLVMFLGALYLQEVFQTKRLNLLEGAATAGAVLQKGFLLAVSLGVLFVVGTFFSTTGRGLEIFIAGGWGAVGGLERIVPLVLLDFGAVAVFLLALTRRNKAGLYAAIFCLLVIPLVQIVSAKDFVMRVSVPAIFVMGVYACGVFLDDFASQPKRRKVAYIVFFALCALTPLSEIWRSATHTAKGIATSAPYVQDDIWSFSNPNLSDFFRKLTSNFCSVSYHNSFYWRHLYPGPKAPSEGR